MMEKSLNVKIYSLFVMVAFWKHYIRTWNYVILVKLLQLCDDWKTRVLPVVSEFLRGMEVCFSYQSWKRLEFCT